MSKPTVYRCIKDIFMKAPDEGTPSVLFSPEVFTVQTSRCAFTEDKEYRALDISSLGTVLFVNNFYQEHVIDADTLKEHFVKVEPLTAQAT